MLIMLISWLVATVVTMLTIKFNSAWIPTVALGLALMTNLSYRHGQLEYTFALFMNIGNPGEFLKIFLFSKASTNT